MVPFFNHGPVVFPESLPYLLRLLFLSLSLYLSATSSFLLQGKRLPDDRRTAALCQVNSLSLAQFRVRLRPLSVASSQCLISLSLRLSLFTFNHFLLGRYQQFSVVKQRLEGGVVAEC